jgi:DNA-binding transcriptional LysR family regulator
MQWHERIGRRLKLRDLHILLAVVQHGSMAKAAAALSISQPAVSKAISDMEHTVGLRLLDRTSQGVEATTYGSVLVKHGTAVFDELRQAKQHLEFLADPTVGELRIGSSESMAAGPLPAIIDRFSRRQPRVALTVEQSVFATAHYLELRERRIDLLLGRLFPSFEDRDLEAEILFDDQLVVVSGSRSRWNRFHRLELGDLAGEQWILPPADSLPGLSTADVFHATGVEMVRAPVTTLSIHLYVQLVASGRFIAMLPHSVLRFSGNRLPIKVLPVKLPILPRPVAIIRLRNRTLSPVAQAFIDCAKAVVRAKWTGSSLTSAQRFGRGRR